MKTPYPFQEEPIRRISTESGFLNADACGLGKSLTAIEGLKRARKIEQERYLVVCLKSAVTQWRDYIEDQDPGTPILIINYIPYKFEKVYGWVIVSHPELLNEQVMSQLCSVLWDAVVLDEAHHIKNRKTLLAEAVKRIPRIKSVALTASPLEKRWNEVWSILDFTHPGMVGSYWRFVRKNFEIEKDWMEHWHIKSPLDPEGFAEYLSEFMIKRSEEEVALDLPELTVTDVPVTYEFGTKLADAYIKFVTTEDIVVDLPESEVLVTNVLAKLTRIQQLMSFPQMYGLNVKSPKELWLNDFLGGNNVQVVVFTRFRPVAEYLAGKFDGDIYTSENRGGEDFKSGKARVIFGTIDAMSESIDWLKSATYSVFYDSHWSSVAMTQATKRIHRIGIAEPKFVYRLFASAEEKLVLDAFDAKLSEIELVQRFLNIKP